MSERRTTKAERKEQARLERLDIQRRMARARRNRRIGVGAVLLALAAAVAVVALRPRPDVPSVRALLARAEAEVSEAGCTDVANVGPYRPEDQDASHVDAMPPFSTYPSIPPASGPHADATLPAGVYDGAPSMAQMLHSLEHGAIVVWYDPAAPRAEIDRIVEFFRQNRDHTIVAPFDYPNEGPAGRLPGGAQMALVAWHHVRSCDRPSLAVAAAFADRYRTPTLAGGSYAGDAPEPGAPI